MWRSPLYTACHAVCVCVSSLVFPRVGNGNLWLETSDSKSLSVLSVNKSLVLAIEHAVTHAREACHMRSLPSR